MKPEQKFEKVVSEIQPQINTLIKKATENLKEAQRLSEKHGVPFESSVVPFDEKVPYIPRNMMEKFHDDDLDDNEDGFQESFNRLMKKASCSIDYIHRESRLEIDFGWNGLFEVCWNSSSLSC